MKLSPLTATSRYVIGKLSMKTRKIRIVNVLTQQEDLLVVCSGACDARVGARLLMGALDPCSHTGRARCRGNAQRDPGPLHREQRARKVVHMETPGRGCVTSHEDERRRAVRKRVRARARTRRRLHAACFASNQIVTPPRARAHADGVSPPRAGTFIEMDMTLTLGENGVPDVSDEFESLGVDADLYIPVIHVYFNDDLTYA